SETLGMTQAEVGGVSLYHSETGVHCVAALVSLARGDLAGAAASLRAFLAAASRPCENPDPTVGRGSLLLGCAMLLEAARAHPTFDVSQVREAGDRLYGGLWSQLGSYPPIRESKEFWALGIAHGWAGLLLVLLRWA